VAATTTNPPPNTPNPARKQGSDDDQEARDAGIDPETYRHENRAVTTTPPHKTVPEIDWERLRYWQAVCADLPPMTEQEIANVALIMRRIDARRAQQHDDLSP
jgi:hypothetical protein